jgi:hypothetical protein
MNEIVKEHEIFIQLDETTSTMRKDVERRGIIRKIIVPALLERYKGGNRTEQRLGNFVKGKKCSEAIVINAGDESCCAGVVEDSRNEI